MVTQLWNRKFVTILIQAVLIVQNVQCSQPGGQDSKQGQRSQIKEQLECTYDGNGGCGSKGSPWGSGIGGSISIPTGGGGPKTPTTKGPGTSKDPLNRSDGEGAEPPTSTEQSSPPSNNTDTGRSSSASEAERFQKVRESLREKWREEKRQKDEAETARALAEHARASEQALQLPPVPAHSYPSFGGNTPSDAPGGSQVRELHDRVHQSQQVAGPNQRSSELHELALEGVATVDRIASSNPRLAHQLSRDIDALNAAASDPRLPSNREKVESAEQLGADPQFANQKHAEDAAKSVFKQMFRAARAGLAEFAESYRPYARELLRFSLDAARMSSVIDLPLTGFELLTGKTIDFDEDLEPSFRNLTREEIAVTWVSMGMNTFSVLTSGGVINTARVISKMVDAGNQVKIAYGRNFTKHVMEGDYKPIKIDGEDYRQISGGLHSVAALQDYIAKAHPSQKPIKITRFPNGVVLALFPEAAFTPDAYTKTVKAASYGRGYVGAKTFFPEGWTEAKIQTAINEILRNSPPSRNTGKGVIYRGVYEGVTIDISTRVNNGKTIVHSAYPASNQ